jgi:subtilisin family serine protease
MAKRISDRRRSPFEALEPRQMMSVSPQALAAAGFEQVDWQGNRVYAKGGQWILKVDNVHGRSAEQLAAVNAKLSDAGRNDVRATRTLGEDGLVLLSTPKGATFANLHASLKGLNGLKYIEPDQLLTTSATTTNDPYLSYEWHLNNTGQSGGTVDADMDVVEAWDLTRGSSAVVVGVIDSGVDYSHPDLAANMWRNPGEVPADGIDNDGNGYADDVYGWDFANNDNAPMDDNGHGTHVAGTIAAAGNNGAGAAGVTWNSKVMALKFLGADGNGSLSGAVAAVNYATKMRSTYGVNVRALNHSYGSGGYSSSLYDAFRNSGTAGILSLVAAGNGGADQVGDNNDSVANYPSNFNLGNVIAVAATDRYDRLGSFSNYGASTVHVAAPGVDIASTVPNGGYAWMSGTSMATPNVAGVAALAFAYSPNASYGDVRNAIFAGADAKASLAGKVATGGRVNAYNTLVNLPTLPAAPTGLAAAAASASQINLTWYDASTNETGFKVYRSTDGVNFAHVATAGANATSYAVTGLAASTTYTFKVVAANTIGDSAASNTASATTQPAAEPAPTPVLVAPAAPTSLTATQTSKNQVSLKWADTSANEAGFRIERSTNNSAWSQIATVGTNVTTYRDSVKPNTRFYYRVRSYNAAGNSAYSNTAYPGGTIAATAAPAATLFSFKAIGDVNDVLTQQDELLA